MVISIELMVVGEERDNDWGWIWGRYDDKS